MTSPGDGFVGSPESHDAAAKAFDAVPDADKAGVVMTAVNTMPDAGKVDVATDPRRLHLRKGESRTHITA